MERNGGGGGSVHLYAYFSFVHLAQTPHSARWWAPVQCEKARGAGELHVYMPNVMWW